jgi:hypothetical protein
MPMNFPDTPTNGQTFTSGGVVWSWNGTAWNPTTTPGGAGVSNVFIGDTAPSNSVNGNLWWNSSPGDGQLYTFFNDGTSSQWVVSNNLGAGLYLPLTGGTLQGPLVLAADPTLPLGAVTKQYVDAAPHSIGRNLLHNGLFNVQQRGTGAWNTNNTYTADRWRLQFTNDTVSATIVAVTDAERATIGDEAAQSKLVIAVTGSSTGGSYTSLYQPIENVRRLSGKTVTLSFWAVGTSALNLSMVAWQVFGSGGSPSATTPSNRPQVTIGTSFARYTATFNLPSAAGKTFGTNVGSDFTQLAFYLSDPNSSGVQSGTFSFWGVQLEVGSVVTPLEKPDMRVDFANCQRFYQIVQVFVVGLYSSASGNAMGAGMMLPVPLRGSGQVITQTGNFSTGPIGAFTWGYQQNGLLYGSATSNGVGYVQVNVALTISADF